ncbi:alkaline phosphatase family protein [Serinicoccus sp. CNJ-927]|uniref:alkaline phosphatase family protein n=1 Tax=Serinicoccus sp. CNJ-927 TaxID=1904970 RepID=UPI0009FB7DD6|nr:nucleotide pyrophosphatase/phosphodiesterase family protein [Serinicoccus sp. CNJ-927]
MSPAGAARPSESGGTGADSPARPATGDVVAAAREAYQPPAPGSGLASVLPGALRALGVEDLPEGVAAPVWSVDPTRRVVVVLADGLGAQQLARRSGHARTLRDLATPEGAEGFGCGFPSTTATSLTSLGTGLPPGGHGIVGWQTSYRGRLFSHLAWKDGPDPHTYQPVPTLLQHAARRDVSMTTVSQQAFSGSGLTRASLRGGGYVGAGTHDERTSGVLQSLMQAGRRGRALVYAYWDEIDKAGHVYGPDSLEWGEAVEVFDTWVAGLLARLPAETTLLVTADHGMIEAPFDQRRDLALDPVLDEGVELLAGEPRAPQAWCRPGAVDDVVATWREELGEEAIVLTREEAVEAGWFGAVREATTRASARSSSPCSARPPCSTRACCDPRCCGCAASTARSPGPRRPSRCWSPRPEPRPTERREWLATTPPGVANGCHSPDRASRMVGRRHTGNPSRRSVGGP